jgi:hypothetical protein
MKKRRIIQTILWTERPTGAVMGAGSLWPQKSTLASKKGGEQTQKFTIFFFGGKLSFSMF